MRHTLNVDLSRVNRQCQALETVACDHNYRGRGISGSVADRRGLDRALKALKHGDVLAVLNLTEARAPAHRVLVGDAKLMALLTAIPTRLRDRMMAMGLGLPGVGAALKEVSR